MAPSVNWNSCTLEFLSIVSKSHAQMLKRFGIRAHLWGAMKRVYGRVSAIYLYLENEACEGFFKRNCMLAL